MTPHFGKQTPEADGTLVIRSFNILLNDISLGNFNLSKISISFSSLENAFSITLREVKEFYKGIFIQLKMFHWSPKEMILGRFTLFSSPSDKRIINKCLD